MIDLHLGDSEAIIAEARKRGILRNQLAYILATAKWETAHTIKPVEEAYWLSDEWRKENLRYYPWHGRGYVQLTWETNYEHAQSELGIGTLLTDNPEMALETDISKQILIQGMMEGWFTGKALGQYVTLKKSDFVGARAVVNGSDKASQIAEIAYQYDTTLKDAGYGEDGPAAPQPAPPTMSSPITDDRAFLISIRNQINDYLGE